MFTWICPQCGKEVPPSSSECPSCAERRQQAAQPPQPPQPQAAPHHQPPPPPPQPQAQPPLPVYTIDNGGRKGLPAWLATLITLIVIGGGLFLLYRYVGARNGSAAAPAAAVTPQPAASTGAHPYSKYIEVAGVRLFESTARKPLVRFTVVNHSPAELSGLELRITFTTAASAPGAEPVAIIDAKVGSIPANGIKDMESALATHLRIYELPDWQFVRTSIEITAPK